MIYDTILSRTLLEKGWSGDKKYRAVTSDGTKYLLRITAPEKAERFRLGFLRMQEVAKLGIPMCLPIEFGECPEGTYAIHSWVDGEDAEARIPTLTPDQQYAYGLDAGRILRRMHTLPAPADAPGWVERYGAKIDRKIAMYRQCPLQYENGEPFLTYLSKNRQLLTERPQSYQHGDYHIGNMMIDRNGQLHVIDFNRNDYGDPWEEFNRIVWCAQKAPLFASGMVNGYFDDQVPMEFWRLLALYISSNTLSSVYWAIPFGQDEVNTMLNQAKEVLSWYDNMRNPVPTWYFRGYYLQYIDGIPLKLKSPFDFDFLKEFGTVFQIFDDQDSGNICFGTEKDGRRYFVKFAGAPAERFDGDPADAVLKLKETLPIYRNLKHRNLIEFVDSKEIGGGFAMVFKWVQGDCMGRMYPAAHRRFMELPLQDRLAVFSDILSFFENIAAQKYVAIDFYDGSILYDFESGRTTICDIDLFRKQPCVNDMGHMWGSSRFQSPEEHQLGAVIDEITNVYTLGATAFALFGGYNRTQDAWELSDKLFAVAAKAVREDCMQRQQSIKQFIKEWEAALQ